MLSAFIGDRTGVWETIFPYHQMSWLCGGYSSLSSQERTPRPESLLIIMVSELLTMQQRWRNNVYYNIMTASCMTDR